MSRSKGLAAHTKQQILCSIYFDANTNTICLENTCNVGIILNCQSFLEYIRGAIKSAILLGRYNFICYTALLKCHAAFLSCRIG